MRYDIVRFYKLKKAPHTKDSEIIKERVTLEEAQAHCNAPESRGDDWFDGYQEHKNHFGAA